tara:strand:+ start:58 stop:480 length:423 start_codon:yes stop_codon:yes gene_type:complete
MTKEIIDFLNIKNYSLKIESHTSVYLWFRDLVLKEIGTNQWDRYTAQNDPILRRSGIYKLSKDGEVVYIGMSINIISRLSTHVMNKLIDFDLIELHTIDGVDKQGLRNIESRMIKAFNPKYNIQKTQTSARKWTNELSFN